MRTLLTAVVSAALLVALAGTSSAYDGKRHRHHKYDGAKQYQRYDNSPSAVAERQRHARTFDSTQYYERDSGRIPFGTAAWWDQKAREGGGRP